MLILTDSTQRHFATAFAGAMFFLLTFHATRARADETSFAESLTFFASFDQGVDADIAKGDRRFYSAASMKPPRVGRPGLPPNGAVSLAPSDGLRGGALRFHRKISDFVFFKAESNLAYRSRDWSGTVSLWLKLDPDEDLEPGYCDPIQITPREWNDAAFFVDFSKDERPRHFRLGAFADRDVWDPDKRDFDSLPAVERPMVTVTRPPFARDRWTHVVFTWESFNTGRADGVARLYLDGQPQGALAGRLQTFTWKPHQTLIMVGLSYIGLFDELALFNRPLTEPEVRQLYELNDDVNPPMR